MQPSITRETIIDRRQPIFRWGAVFAGAAVAIGLWVLLQTFGMGIGLAAIDTDNTGSLRSVGIGTTVWSLIAPIIAMFCGGLIAARFATTFERGVGAIHGLVVWALGSVLGVVTLIWIVTVLAMGAVRVGGAAISATTSMVHGVGAQASDIAGSVGLNADDIVAPVNKKLQEQGKPPISADQLKDAIRGVAKTGLREGHLDKQMVAAQLAEKTQMSQEDAQDVANQLSQRWDEMSGQMNEAAEQATHAALSGAEATGKALLFGGLSLLLSLIAAVLGGIVGLRRNHHHERRRTTTITTSPPPAAPVVTTEPVP
jgi:hypothetical protein